MSCGNPHSCWAHSNSLEHGKGMGDKAHDLFGAYLCQKCHDWYDGRSNIEPPSFVHQAYVKSTWFMDMWDRSMITACEKGYL